MEDKDILDLALKSSIHANYSNFERTIGHKNGFIAGYKAALQNKFGEYQLCPKCNGNGFIRTPFIDTTKIAELCDICSGAKIIAKPIIKSIPVNEVKEDSEKDLYEDSVYTEVIHIVENYIFQFELYLDTIKKLMTRFTITRKVKEEDKPTPLIPDRDLEYFKKLNK